LKVLVTGASGMVGRAVVAHCESQGDEVSAFDRRALDIADYAKVTSVVATSKPDVVINCAAWTDVDGCESGRERALAANAQGPENLARASKEFRACLITISTDYVFDGTKGDFYTQRDDPNPQSIYALSKLEGERRAQLAHARTIVVRSGFIFGPGGRNFLSNVVDLARSGKQLKAINDAYGTPTYGLDLARQLRRLALLDLPGIYHVVNEGAGASYEQIVWAMLEEANVEGDVVAVAMDSINRPAPRPRDSRLKCLLSQRLGLPDLPPWRLAVRDFVSRTAKQGDKVEESAA
jgi:dTDP-4-dehydrorhamnose reductase